MAYFTVILIAIGLSMDAFAAAVANGAMMTFGRARHAFRIAFFFGVFQAAMPVVGWFAGLSFRGAIQNFDHWVAFFILLIIGGRMCIEAIRNRPSENSESIMSYKKLFLLSVATSIDALAIGITFSVLDVSIIAPVLIIGLVTFLISLLGVYLGKYLDRIFGRKVEIVGGLILIGIGIKILIEHILFNI